MKKYSLRTIIIISLVIFIFPAWAQVEVDLGAIGGVNLSTLSIDPNQGLDISSRTGFAFGAVLVLNLNPMVAIQIEPKYIQSGANVSAEEDGLKIEGSFRGTYTNTPLLLKLSFGTGTFKPYIIAGGYSGILLSAKRKIDKATLDGQDVTNQIPSDERETDIKEQTKALDMGLNFGAGVTIPAGNIQLLFQADYSLGLVNINDDPEDPDTKIKNRGIQLKAGLVFPIGR